MMRDVLWATPAAVVVAALPAQAALSPFYGFTLTLHSSNEPDGERNTLTVYFKNQSSEPLNISFVMTTEPVGTNDGTPVTTFRHFNATTTKPWTDFLSNKNEQTSSPYYVTEKIATTTPIPAATGPDDQSTWYDFQISFQGDFLGNRNTIAKIEFDIVGTTTVTGKTFSWHVDTIDYPSPDKIEKIIHTEMNSGFRLSYSTNDANGLW